MLHCIPKWTTCLWILAAASPSFGESTWKLYDVRDLIGALPSSSGGRTKAKDAGAGHMDDAPSFIDSFSSRPDASQKSEDQPGSNVDALLDQICDAMSISCTQFAAGVYGIKAEETNHVALASMLESIRELYRETYAVELILSRSPSEHAPAIGAEVKLEKPEYRQHFVVTRRTPTPIAMHSINTFLSGVEPVVAQGAVAYQSVDSAVSDGLDVTVLVGVNGDNQHGTTLQLSGELRKVSWPENLSEATPVDTTPLKLRFPIVSVRSVQSRLDVKYEKPTVLSVLAGFEAGESIVITALVRKL